MSSACFHIDLVSTHVIHSCWPEGHEASLRRQHLNCKLDRAIQRIALNAKYIPSQSSTAAPTALNKPHCRPPTAAKRALQHHLRRSQPPRDPRCDSSPSPTASSPACDPARLAARLPAPPRFALTGMGCVCIASSASSREARGVREAGPRCAGAVPLLSSCAHAQRCNNSV